MAEIGGRMTTLPAMLASIVRHYGERPAIIADEMHLTWDGFGARVARLAGVLAARGVSPGDRFAIICRNGFRFEELKYAGYWLGAIPVPVNWRLAPPEIEHILRDADCGLVVVADSFVEMMSAPALTPWSGNILHVADDATASPHPHYDLMLADTDPLPPAAPGEDDDALLLYTGGTTGRAKGVRLSHRNIIANALQYGYAIGARRDDIYLHVAPMFHSADLLATSWIILGCAQAYVGQFTPAEFFRVVETHKPTATILVPAMIIMTLSDPDFARRDLSSLRLVGYGAAPMALEWVRRFADGFPDAALTNCYGLTETAPDLTVFDPGEFRSLIESGATEGPVTSVGKPAPGVELRVLNDDGGEIGELLGRGRNITRGYLNLPEETAAALDSDGWLHTGDIARIDEQGYVYLLDRAKDMVISGGMNVYSSEVEAVLHTCPGVHEAAVIGVPDDRLGEALFAVIVAAPGASLDEATIIEHCRSRIGGYKIPRRMAFMDAMPKSAMGKILKTELRALYSDSR